MWKEVGGSGILLSEKMPTLAKIRGHGPVAPVLGVSKCTAQTKISGMLIKFAE
jgi:hypothetical protein